MFPIKRILNEGVLIVGALPDIDNDLSAANRHKVFNYLQHKYDNVARVCNFTFAKSRTAVRRACTAFGIPLDIVDPFCKIVDRDQPLEFSLGQSDVQEYIKQYRLEEVIEAAKFFTGMEEGTTNPDSMLPAHLGVHAAAIVIAPSEMTDFVPLMNDKNSEMLVAMYDMHGCEKVGLVKYDFLGLAAIDIIYDAAADAGIDVETIPLDDPKVFDFLASGIDTYGVFQLEKKLTNQIMKAAPPKNISDIGAITSVIRPGPMHSGFHKTYIAGNATHRIGVVNEVLAETKGVLLYQEQLMTISQKMAGFTEVQADDLRQGIGKKKKALIDKYRSIFIQGSMKNGYTEQDAQEIYSWFEAAAAYAFNKSHAIMYSVISYYCAWLRFYYPLQFFAAFLNAYITNADKINEALRRIKRMGFGFLVPDINLSAGNFTVKDGKLLFGLNAIKGLGQKTADKIVGLRNNGWKTVGEFANQKRISDSVKILLVKSGCLDRLTKSRNQGLARLADKNTTEHLFPEDKISNIKGETDNEKGLLERELLGLAITKNPLEDIEAFHRTELLTITDLEPEHVGNKIRICCVITKITRKVAKNSKKSQYVELILSDPYNEMIGMVYEKWIPAVSEYIDKINIPMFVMGWLNVDTFKKDDEDDDTMEEYDKIDVLQKGKISVQSIEPVYMADRIKVHITLPEDMEHEKMKKLQTYLLASYSDHGYPVVVHQGKRSAIIEGVRIEYTDGLVHSLKHNYQSMVEKK